MSVASLAGDASERWSTTDQRAGAWSCYTVLALSLVYVPVLIAGLVAAPPGSPVPDPYNAVLELLIIPISLAMVIAFVAVHRWAAPQRRLLSASALVLVALTAGITICVHSVLLTVGRQSDAASLPGYARLLSWTWPSVVFALDIVAWDLFLGVALLLAAPVLDGWPSRLLALGGVLCLGGITGAVIGDMSVRDIGIVGYAVVLPVALLLQGRRFAAAFPARQSAR